MAVEITTNNIYRELTEGYNVPSEIWENEFEWSTLDGQFFKYKNIWYALSECMVVDQIDEFVGWDAIYHTTYFSGVLVKLSDDGESVKVGTFYSK